jgi:hypothetical protein
MKRILAAAPAMVATLVIMASTTPALLAQCVWSPGSTTNMPCNASIGAGAPVPASLLEVWGANPVLKITQRPDQAGASLLSLTPAGGGGDAGNISGIALRGGSPYIYNDAGDANLINIGSDRLQSHAKFVFNVNTGTLGVGSAYPTWKLEVKHSSANTTFAGDVAQFGLGLINSNGAVDTWSNISFAQADQGSVKASIGIQYRANNITDFVLATQDGTALTEKMRITGAGRVGIGTLLPSEKLDVTGNIRATGSITGGTVIGAVYQDFAEWVPASEPMAPGTVVVVDGSARNGVAPSAHSYDTRVAGVVSANPGVILGVEGASKAKVATSGRVKVRVDATKAPIAVGDLLVTSDIAGTAMKSQPLDLGGIAIHRPGTLIGKALEPLPNGEGEILVLLSLQ